LIRIKEPFAPLGLEYLVDSVMHAAMKLVWTELPDRRSQSWFETMKDF